MLGIIFKFHVMFKKKRGVPLCFTVPILIAEMTQQIPVKSKLQLTKYSTVYPKITLGLHKSVLRMCVVLLCSRQIMQMILSEVSTFTTSHYTVMRFGHFHSSLLFSVKFLDFHSHYIDFMKIQVIIVHFYLIDLLKKESQTVLKIPYFLTLWQNVDKV